VLGDCQAARARLLVTPVPSQAKLAGAWVAIPATRQQDDGEEIMPDIVPFSIDDPGRGCGRPPNRRDTWSNPRQCAPGQLFAVRSEILRIVSQASLLVCGEVRLRKITAPRRIWTQITSPQST